MDSWKANLSSMIHENLMMIMMTMILPKYRDTGPGLARGRGTHRPSHRLGGSGCGYGH